MNINRQRRAIESFVGQAEATPPGDTTNARIWTADDVELFPLGISDGVGTCSDIHGMDVLVLAACHPSLAVGKLVTGKCAYTVEFRSPTSEEVEIYGRPIYCALGAVELLQLVEAKNGSIIFERTGKSRVYPRLL